MAWWPNRSSSTADAAQLQLQSATDTVIVRLKRTPAARRFTLRVRNATRDVVLTMPHRASLKDARSFAERHAEWIADRLKQLPEPLPFSPGAIIPLRGMDHRIEHRPEARGIVWVEANGPHPGEPLALCVAGSEEHVGRRVRDYLRRQALMDLRAAVEHHARTLELEPRKISIRDSKTRWGSCSASGSLNFSWRIILAPAFVLDYLAAHEVAHLVHMNHSRQFWALTRRLSPDMDRAEAWLNSNGARLHRYGETPPAD